MPQMPVHGLCTFERGGPYSASALALSAAASSSASSRIVSRPVSRPVMRPVVRAEAGAASPSSANSVRMTATSRFMSRYLPGAHTHTDDARTAQSRERCTGHRMRGDVERIAWSGSGRRLPSSTTKMKKAAEMKPVMATAGSIASTHSPVRMMKTCLAHTRRARPAHRLWVSSRRAGMARCTGIGVWGSSRERQARWSWRARSSLRAGVSSSLAFG